MIENPTPDADVDYTMTTAMQCSRWALDVAVLALRSGHGPITPFPRYPDRVPGDGVTALALLAAGLLEALADAREVDVTEIVQLATESMAQQAELATAMDAMFGDDALRLAAMMDADQ